MKHFNLSLNVLIKGFSREHDGENTSTIHGPLAMIIFFNLKLASGRHMIITGCVTMGTRPE